MSPILVRPVREQLEHDRVIRLLQVRLKRRHDVATNIGGDQQVPVKIGSVQIYPDLVLTTSDKARKLVGTVEVETGESVNNLEAMSQWAHLGRAKAPFHLYVPVGSVDSARRLATENQVNVAELWSFYTIGDQTRFTLVHRAPPKSSSKPGGSARAQSRSAKKSAVAPGKKTKPAGRAAKPAARKASKPQKRK